MFSLKDRIAIVTRSSRGIERTIALELVCHGCRVAVVCVNSSAATEGTCAEIRKMFTRAEAYRCDASDSAQCRAVVRRIMDNFGRVDVLVSNAGAVKDAVTTSIKDEDLAAVFDTNLKGAIHMIRERYFSFTRQRLGPIINVSLVAALLDGTGQTTHAAAEAGLIGLTKSVARETVAQGVRCNVTAPGIIETEMTGFMQDDESRLALVPMHRFGKPTEVTSLMIFLAGDASSYITGEIIRVGEGLAT